MKIRQPPPLPRDADIEPQIDTPVIRMQDLEHQANAQTRVNDAGVEVLPEMNLSREDEEARQAIEALERALKSL